MNVEREMARPLKEFDLNLGYHFSEVLSRPLARPYWVYISTTHNCNFNCQMCGVKKILRGCELDIDVLKRALDEVAGWNSDCVVVLTGGEPFLRKDIFDIIAYSVSLGLKTEVVTNGSQIADPEIAKRIIASGLRNIAFSIDGALPQTHDYIRGREGAHKKSLESISYLSRGKRIRNIGPQISIWTTIMKENVEELCDIASLAKEAGVDCLVYHPVIMMQDDMQNTIKEGHLWISEDEIGILKQQIDKIIDYQKKNGLIAFLHDPYLWLKYFCGTLTKKEWRCNPFVFIDIGPDGLVRSCGPAFGNIKEMSLTDCLNTPEAKKARERMQNCRRPCLQTCWGRPEADSLIAIAQDFIIQIEAAAVKKEEKRKLLEQGVGLLTGYEKLILQES